MGYLVDGGDCSSWGQEVWWAQDKSSLLWDHRWSGVIQEHDSMPRGDSASLLITRGASLKHQWRANSPNSNMIGDMMLLKSK